MSGITPPPWVQFANRGRTVAIMPAGRPGTVCNFAEPYPSDEDAALMNAAPKLLKVALRVAALNERAGEIGAGMLASLVVDARAAIAEATGVRL